MFSTLIVLLCGYFLRSRTLDPCIQLVVCLFELFKRFYCDTHIAYRTECRREIYFLCLGRNNKRENLRSCTARVWQNNAVTQGSRYLVPRCTSRDTRIDVPLWRTTETFCWIVSNVHVACTTILWPDAQQQPSRVREAIREKFCDSPESFNRNIQWDKNSSLPASI